MEKCEGQSTKDKRPMSTSIDVNFSYYRHFATVATTWNKVNPAIKALCVIL